MSFLPSFAVSLEDMVEITDVYIQDSLLQGEDYRSLKTPSIKRSSAAGVWLDYIGERLQLKRPGVIPSSIFFGFQRKVEFIGSGQISNVTTITSESSAAFTFEGVSFVVDFTVITATVPGEVYSSVADLMQIVLQEAGRSANVQKIARSSIFYDATRNSGSGAFIVRVRGSIGGAFTGAFADELGLQVGTINIENDNVGFDQGPFSSIKPIVGNRIPLADRYYRSLLRMRGVYLVAKNITIPVLEAMMVAAGLSFTNPGSPQVVWHRNGRMLTGRVPVPPTNLVFQNLGDYWYPAGS